MPTLYIFFFYLFSWQLIGFDENYYYYIQVRTLFCLVLTHTETRNVHVCSQCSHGIKKIKLEEEKRLYCILSPHRTISVLFVTHCVCAQHHQNSYTPKMLDIFTQLSLCASECVSASLLHFQSFPIAINKVWCMYKNIKFFLRWNKLLV